MPDTNFINKDYWSKIRRQEGLFDRLEIDIYNEYHRFGLFNPYEALSDTREFLFFVKPDLHIMDGKTGALNDDLKNNPFFIELVKKYPDVIPQLQYSADKFNNPLSLMLSNNVMSTLDVPSLSANTIDNPSNIYGTSYEYRGSSESGDDNFDFALEFEDTKHLDMYMYFKAYEEYETLKRHGRVSPPIEYIQNKILHDQMGIYKFLVGEDGETIVFYAYYCGVMWKSLPRDVFSNNSFTDGLRYSIDGKAAFVEDMNPLIISDFNTLTSSYRNSHTSSDLSIYDSSNDRTSMEPAKSAYITKHIDTMSGREKYKLKWRS